MNRLKLKVFVFLFVLQASTYLNASVVQNGDFENGLANWSVSRNSDFQGDPILVVTQFQNYSPTKGSSFALLRSSLENTYNRLFQAVNLKAGDRLAGSAFFKTQDYLPFDDDAYIRIVELDAVLFSSRVSAVGDYGGTPWTNFEFTIPTTGTFTIELAVRNAIDGAASSYLGVDNLRAVPEPTSMATVSLASVFLLGRLKRLRKKLVR
ncbi:MAG: hypothetical protein NT168_07055 [Planctomycetota bacterium]|nr:hypothetical protein [Planctomycetota bacterium]